MINKSLTFLVLTILLLSENFYTQINGLSASKLFVYDAITIKPGSFEFEVCTKTFTARSQFDENANTVLLNGRLYESELDFRFTFGLMNDVEVGVEIPSDLDKLFLATKIKLYKTSFVGISAIAGAGYGIKSRFINYGQTDTDRYENFSAGTVSTFKVTDDTSIDLHLIFTRLLKDEVNHHLHFAAGYGYFLKENLQVVLEVNGKKQINGENNIDKIMITPGITFDPAENFSVTAAVHLDVAGKNIEKGLAFFTGFTIWFD